MKSLTLPTIVGLFATLCVAAPAPVQLEARQTTTLSLTFFGAGENPPSYEIDVTLESQENFQSFTITNPLSVSKIFLGGPGFCDITGVDGSQTTVQGGYEADVGPPQAQVSGVCSTF
ncbi:hypothetical protein P7C71_g4264, partial [Lecanoromycetidae sp. Uapishka_2]